MSDPERLLPEKTLIAETRGIILCVCLVATLGLVI
jgi:hypothetical protein